MKNNAGLIYTMPFVQWKEADANRKRGEKSPMRIVDERWMRKLPHILSLVLII